MLHLTSVMIGTKQPKGLAAFYENVIGKPADMVDPDAGDRVKEEFERIKAAGARVVREPYEIGEDGLIATLADPDGNFFQLVTPMGQ